MQNLNKLNEQPQQKKEKGFDCRITNTLSLVPSGSFCVSVTLQATPRFARLSVRRQKK